MRLLMPLAALLTLPSVTPAVELVPLELRPISVSLTVTPSGSPGIPALPGISSASLSSDFQSGEFVGSFEAAAVIEAQTVRIELSGVATSTQQSASNTLNMDITVSFELDVPMIGEAMTPIFVDIDPVTEHTDGWNPPFLSALATISNDGLFGEELYSAPGTSVGIGIQVNGPRQTVTDLFPAGETLRFDIRILAGPSISAGSVGSFINSSVLRFRTLTPNLGSGDVNADGSVDILDVTLMRRGLAGLPLVLAR